MHPLRSKSLLGRARRPLGARNHCSGTLRSHLALEIAARAGFFFFDGTRKHRTGVVFSHFAFESTARACSAATGCAKSLLGRASKPLSARNRCASRLLCIRQHSKTPHQRCFFPHSARNHCSGVLRSHLALEIIARAGFFLFDSTFVFPSKSLSKSLCFELRIASSCALCDFTGTVRCHMRI